ncbi:serine hydrolase domain-containing protein [Actinosynnema sp. NPDC023587]|uniref:serine hydrolase domain-containing protein n=1 Tax=Actinosynnema sp. NPDC023587 TaxID=3154695 RepID=UPI0033D1C263
MGNGRRAPWVFGCLVALLAGCSGGVIEEPSRAEVLRGQRINEFHQELKREGFRGVVDVRRHGERLLSEAYGMADTATSRANTPRTRFRAGAMTEQVTAFAVLEFQSTRRLTLTDPVCRHLPTCVPGWQAITVDNLLLHTSGLPDYLVSGLAAPDGNGLSHLAFVERLQRAPVERAPGKWKYSASDYVVLGALIEALAAQPYGQYVRSTILEPLGMGATTATGGQDDPESRAVGHADAQRPVAPSPAPRFADLALSTTAADLGVWNNHLVAGTAPGTWAESWDRLRSPSYVSVGVGRGGKQGYGVVFRDVSSVRGIHASGALPGFEAWSGVNIEAKVTVAVLANADGAKVDDLGERLLALASG